MMQVEELIYKIPDLIGGYIHYFLDGNNLITRNNDLRLISKQPINLISKGIVTEFGVIYVLTPEEVYFADGTKASRNIVNNYLIHKAINTDQLQKGILSNFTKPKIGKPIKISDETVAEINSNIKPITPAENETIKSSTEEFNLFTQPKTEVNTNSKQTTQSQPKYQKGQERPGHKYIRRTPDPKNPGQYIYIYEEEKTNKVKFYNQDEKEIKAPRYDVKFHDNQYKNQAGWKQSEQKRSLSDKIYGKGNDYEYDLGEGNGKLIATHSRNYPESLKYIHPDGTITNAISDIQSRIDDPEATQNKDELFIDTTWDKEDKRDGIILYNKNDKSFRIVKGDWNESDGNPASKWVDETWEYRHAQSKDSQEKPNEPEIKAKITTEPISETQPQPENSKGKEQTPKNIDTIPANIYKIGDRITNINGVTGQIADITGRVAIIKADDKSVHLIKLEGKQDLNKVNPDVDPISNGNYSSWRQQQTIKRKELTNKFRNQMRDEVKSKRETEKQIQEEKRELEKQRLTKQKEADKTRKIQQKETNRKKKQINSVIKRFEAEGIPVPEALEKFRDNEDSPKSLKDLLDEITELSEDERETAYLLFKKTKPEQQIYREKADSSTPIQPRQRKTKKQKLSDEERERITEEQKEITEKAKLRNDEIQSQPEYEKYKNENDVDGYSISGNPYISTKTTKIDNYNFTLIRSYNSTTKTYSTKISDAPYTTVQVNGTEYEIEDILNDEVHFTETVEDVFGGDQIIKRKMKISDLKKMNGNRIFEKTQKSKGLISLRPPSPIIFADQTIEEYGQWEIVEIEDVIASHTKGGTKNPKYSITGAQNRKREGDSEDGMSFSQANILDRAQNMDFRLMSPENLTAWDGAPIVNQDYEVIGGNGRVLSVDTHYSMNKEEYKNKLVESAERLGFNEEDVKKMKNPIAVRKVNADKEKSEILGPLTNKTTAEVESPTEKNIKYASLIKSDTKKYVAGHIRGAFVELQNKFYNAQSDKEKEISTPSTGNILSKAGFSIVRKLQEDGVISQNELQDFYDSKTKTLNMGQKDKLTGVLAHLYLPKIRHDYTSLPDATQKGINSSLGALYSIEDQDYSLSDELDSTLQLLSKYQTMKANGDKSTPHTFVTIQDSDMFATNDFSENKNDEFKKTIKDDTRAMFLALAGATQAEIRSVLNNYVLAVKNNDGFNEDGIKSKSELIKKIFTPTIQIEEE